MKRSILTKLLLSSRSHNFLYTNTKRKLSLVQLLVLSVLADYKNANMAEPTIGDLAELLDVRVAIVRYTAKTLANNRLVKYYGRKSLIGAPYKIPTLTKIGTNLMSRITFVV